jgi:ribose-phosphate pyrophosphokinase
VRGEDVFILQSTSFPTNDHLMELLIMIDAFMRSSASASRRSFLISATPGRIAAPPGRTPISAKLVANMITRAGADRVLTLDLHAGQIQGFFDIPTDNLFSVPVMARDVKANTSSSTTWWWYRPTSAAWCAPVRWPSASTRSSPSSTSAASVPGESEVMNIIGEVPARIACSSTTSSIPAALCATPPMRCWRKGATSVTAYITHGVLSGGAAPASPRRSCRNL